MKNKKTLIGDKPYFYKLSPVEGFDINTVQDFEFGEFLFNKEFRNEH